MRTGRVVRVSLLLSVLLVGATAWGQNLNELKETTPKERAAAQTAMMKEKLALSEAQLPKVAALNLTYAEKMEPVIQGSEGLLMRIEQAKQLETAKEAELSKLVSPAQFQKFLASKTEMREKLLDKVMEQRAHSGG